MFEVHRELYGIEIYCSRICSGESFNMRLLALWTVHFAILEYGAHSGPYNNARPVHGTKRGHIFGFVS